MPAQFRRPAALLLATALSAAPALAAPAIWEVSDADSSIHIFGSFHILPDDAQWRTPLFDELLATAGKIVFETDIGPTAQAAIGAEAFVRGIYTDGTLLIDVIDDDTEAHLRAVTAEIGVPMGTVLAMRPWMAANTVSLGALAQAGYGTQGVEMTLNPEIASDRMVFLETGNQQLDVLAGAPEAEQVAMLDATLDQMPMLEKLMAKMLDNWLAGTPDSLGELFMMEMGGFEEAFMERLIYARNRKWVAPLEQMLADNESAFVIVGAAHMIGDGGVTDLLEKAGYTVERVQ